MSTQNSGWVMLNYPIVTSRSRDNAGGFDHLVGNLLVYQRMGFKVVCICRWSPRLVDRLEGALMLNIVPGLAVPVTLSPSTDQPAPSRPILRWRVIAQNVRAGALFLLGAGLQRLLRPRLLHQRANQRLMLAPRGKETVHLVELNDDYLPPNRCDAYLTVTQRPAVATPQFVWRWPVPEVARFDGKRFMQRLAGLARPSRRLKVLLFGIGGTTAVHPIRDFISAHPWFQDTAFDLHVFGGDGVVPDVAGVVQHGWCDPARLDTLDFDAALLYYDPKVYDDERLRLGSPTKLWKYIDWSLPVFCNRDYISQEFLGQFDCTREVLLNPDLGRQFAEYYETLRNQTLPTTYADGLGAFLVGLGCVSFE